MLQLVPNLTTPLTGLLPHITFPSSVQIQNLISLGLWIPIIILLALLIAIGSSRVFFIYAGIFAMGLFVPPFSTMFSTWWNIPLIQTFQLAGIPITIKYGTIYMVLLSVTFMALLGAMVHRGSESPVVRGGGVFLIVFAIGATVALLLTGQLDKVWAFFGFV